MRFNVAQLLKEGSGAVRQYVLSGAISGVDEANAEPVPVVGEVSFVRTVRGILVTGTAELDLWQNCRRCTEPAKQHVFLDVEEEFVPTIDVITGTRRVLDKDDEPDLLIDEHHLLDLSDILHQYALVAVSQPGLCREDCKGLCPVCGSNRNTTKCGCSQTVSDPRFAVLADLLNARGIENHPSERESE